MKAKAKKQRAEWLDHVSKNDSQNIVRPERPGDSASPRLVIQQGLGIVLAILMIPMGQGALFAQYAPPPPGADQGPPPPQGADQGPPPPGADQGPPPGADQGPPPQPMSPDQLDQLIAPIALYPDALVAQVLAGATFPMQIVEADRWLQSQGNAPPDQIAANADAQNWDPSVKALTAFPSVLAQMDRNLQWTTDLGNAYYNQPQDVMSSVQAMRERAERGGDLRSTQQEMVTNEGGYIAIAPANPNVVYVPAYNPWVVYGGPLVAFPGYYYAPPAGVFFGGLAIGFGVGIGIAAFGHFGWGWGHWGVGWRDRAVVFNHNTYVVHSRSVINRGFSRPGGPGGAYGAARPGVGYNRPGGAYNRPGGAYNRPGGAYNRPGGAYNRPGVENRGVAGANYARPAGNARPAANAHPAGNARPAGKAHPAANGHEGNNQDHR